MPQFSVIIPTKDRLPLLQQALISVFQQTFKDFEVIVVDDGSKDGTVRYLEELDKRVTVLRSGGSGAAAARNLGLKKATAPYVVFLDSDDLWFSWTLETLSSITIQQDQPSIIINLLHLFEDVDSLEEVEQSPLEIVSFKDYFASTGENLYVGASMMVIRKELLESVGGFDVSFVCAEDHDLTLRLGVAEKCVRIVSPSTVAYRQHEGNMSRGLHDRFQGVSMLVDGEYRGKYPGSDLRRGDRRRIILSHVIPVVLDSLELGRRQSAVRLYCRTFTWALGAHRSRYLVGFWWRWFKSFFSSPHPGV